jgi:hypothetical protein
MLGGVDTTTTGRPVRRGSRTAALAGLGLLAGVAAKAADASGVGWLADVGSYPAAWVLAVALLARSARSTRSAATGSAVFFAVMSVGYYGWAVGVLGFGLRANLVLLAVWVALSLTAVPAFAAVVHEACTRRGLLPGALLAGAASLALADRTLWHLVVRPEGAALHPVQGVVAAVVALVVAGVLPRHHRTRVVALALLVPAAVVATAAVDVLYAVLPG